MQDMSLKLEVAIRNKHITLINNVWPYISHLLYADDIILFATTNVKTVQTIKHVTAQLALAAGLNINQLKTKVYFSSDCHSKNELLEILQMQEANHPVKYLGAPLYTDYLHYSECNSLFQRIINKFETWDGKLLSIVEG